MLRYTEKTHNLHLSLKSEDSITKLTIGTVAKRGDQQSPSAGSDRQGRWKNLTVVERSVAKMHQLVKDNFVVSCHLMICKFVVYQNICVQCSGLRS